VKLTARACGRPWSEPAAARRQPSAARSGAGRLVGGEQVEGGDHQRVVDPPRRTAPNLGERHQLDAGLSSRSDCGTPTLEAGGEEGGAAVGEMAGLASFAEPPEPGGAISVSAQLALAGETRRLSRVDDAAGTSSVGWAMPAPLPHHHPGRPAAAGSR
jgi:hypothetical protein